MRRSAALLLALALVVTSGVWAGCVGNETPEEAASASSTPATALPDEGPPIALPALVNGLEHRAHVDAEQGFDVATRGSWAYVAARSGFYTVNISDPDEPVKHATIREAGSRYVELMPQEDRLIAAASGANQEVLHFLDVTDPEQPELLSSFDPGRAVHNTGVVPGTSLFYNPRGVGDATDPGIDIIDASDPANPEVVKRWSFPATANGQPVQTAGCGVVTFQLSQDRAFCPAVSQTYILDVSDLMEPEVVSVISNPAINVHHWTQQMHGGDTLLIADWAAAGNTPTCRSAGPTAGPPPGAVWAYDISDPSDPQALGYIDVPAPEGVGPDEQCSPHVVEQVGDQDRAVVGWHRAGVVLLDVSDPSNLEVLDRWQAGGNAWSIDVHGGLALAPDRDAGLDLVELTG